jgi:hypothetical protein
MNKCSVCGRQRQGNAGDYYHEKDCQRKSVLGELETATESEKPRLRKMLAAAEYVGD